VVFTAAHLPLSAVNSNFSVGVLTLMVTDVAKNFDFRRTEGCFWVCHNNLCPGKRYLMTISEGEPSHLTISIARKGGVLKKPPLGRIPINQAVEPPFPRLPKIDCLAHSIFLGFLLDRFTSVRDNHVQT
jgi:hypothetical protein